MGRASRWLRGLLGGKRSVPSDPKPEKKKWGFVKSFREKGPVTAPERRNDTYSEVGRAEEAQSKRAIAVAAATAAVADAAVAAAQAAAVVVRMTSGRALGREAAVVKIQAAFRGYLARRALRALRGLVKLQALVRGNIVRKQAAETLRCMHALVRVQARARACRVIRSERGNLSKPSQSHPGPPTPEKHEQPRAVSFKRSSSKAASADSERAQSSGWNWLDRWMEERYWDSRESATKTIDDEKSAKILEIDNGKPKRRTISYIQYPQSSCSTVTSDRNSRSFATVVDSPSVDSSVAQHCVPSPSSVDKQPQQQPLSPLGFPVLETSEYTGESPQFFSASSRPGSSRRGPFTPAKSDCARSLFSAYSDYPNYMSNTESSRAKVRSQSAPRQRPDFEKSGSLKRMSAPAAPPAAPPQKTLSSMQTKYANKAYPGSGRLDRLGMPIRY